jgi:hypothetical protein
MTPDLAQRLTASVARTVARRLHGGER